MPSRPAAPPADELLRLLLEQGEDYALFLMTPEGTITDWFHGAEHIFGFAPQDIVGTSSLRLFNQHDIERGAAHHEMELAATAGRSEDDRWHVRADGTHVWGSGVLIALRNATGGLAGFAKILRNRTDVKTQTEALENQLKALQEADRQKNTFLGLLGHELRNPLGTLSNAVDLLRLQVPGPEARAPLDMIGRQMALLRRLVDDLMDTARISAGKVDLQLGVIDLLAVAQAAAEAARPSALAREQTFDTVFISGPVLVHGDAHRLRQVFGNLLDNAIKYTPSGGKIVFNVTTEGGDAVARVEDSGVGMSADVLPRVFDLFSQEESSRQFSAGGVGLGLALVRDLVSLHGGTVQARSDGRDKGSVFTVRLPMHAAEQP